MPSKNKQPQIPLPKSWGTHVKTAILHVVALAQYALTYSRSWAADSSNERVRLKAEWWRTQKLSIRALEIKHLRRAWTQTLSRLRHKSWPPARFRTHSLSKYGFCTTWRRTLDLPAHRLLHCGRRAASLLGIRVCKPRRRRSTLARCHVCRYHISIYSHHGLSPTPGHTFCKVSRPWRASLSTSLSRLNWLIWRASRIAVSTPWSNTLN